MLVLKLEIMKLVLEVMLDMTTVPVPVLEMDEPESKP